MATSNSVTVGAAVEQALPDWITNPDPAPITLSPEAKKMHESQFALVYPRVLDKISSGSTLTEAIKDLPIELDLGAFMRWINKDPSRKGIYKDAKEVRTEAWAAKLIEYCGGEDTLEDVQRSKLKVDTLKWLMAADNRRTYGEVKQVELGGSISVLGALEAANRRVIEAEVIEIIEKDD